MSIAIATSITAAMAMAITAVPVAPNGPETAESSGTLPEAITPFLSAPGFLSAEPAAGA